MMSFLNLMRKNPNQKSPPRGGHQTQPGGRLGHPTPTPRASALNDSKLDDDDDAALLEIFGKGTTTSGGMNRCVVQRGRLIDCGGFQQRGGGGLSMQGCTGLELGGGSLKDLDEGVGGNSGGGGGSWTDFGGEGISAQVDSFQRPTATPEEDGMGNLFERRVYADAGGMNPIGRGLSLRASDLVQRAASDGPGIGGGGGSCLDEAPAAQGQGAMGGMVGRQHVALLRDPEVIEEIAKEVMALRTNQLADLKELLSRLLNEREEGRAVDSSDVVASESKQQLKDAATVRKAKKKEVSVATKNKTKNRCKQDENAATAKQKQKKTYLTSGGFTSLIMVAFGSITMLIFSLSLIHQSGGSREGEAPPAMPPSAARYLRQANDLSNDDDAASASALPEIIMSPLPAASIIVPPPDVSSVSANRNRRMKFDNLRLERCFDTPNWKDKYGDGCDWYEENREPGSECPETDQYAGDMGPATEQCCFCGGGHVSLPPSNSPTISNSQTKSASPSVTCLDTPKWKDRFNFGCDEYENPESEYVKCDYADHLAGEMGPATTQCCFCGGGSVTLPPTNSPTISNSPTKSATPSTSPTSSPSSSPSISSNPTEFCLDTPNWKDKYGEGCDKYKNSCFYADRDAGDMGPATTHCCDCQGGIGSCDDFRSKCQDYLDVLGIKDGVMSALCEGAESCSCGDHHHDVEFATTDDSVNYFDTEVGKADHTVGLYNECKCDFWSRLCEDSGVGEACDYAAEYCCGEYMNYHTRKFIYMNSPTCYCDVFAHAQREFKYTLKPKAMNISEEFDNPCDELEEQWIKWSDRTTNEGEGWERTSLEAIYNVTKGWNWKNNDGWMNKTLDHCHWYGISCNDDERITRIDLRDNNLAGQFPVFTRNFALDDGDVPPESYWRFTKYGLANLYKLKTVDLASNKLTGTIDYRPLYNLASLEHFDVSGNQLSGGMDALVSPSIVLSDFSNNNFTSMRRFDKYKGSYQTLRFCQVSNNAIQINVTDRLENIPPNIEQFFAQNNQIYGSFPDSINDLPHLRQFDMSSNTISGSLSESLNNLPQLRYFNMSSNSLTGGLPESLNNLPQLRQFDISSNTFSGQLPDFAGSFLSLQEIDVSNQAIGFTGSIPGDLARLQSLKVLKLAGNKLTGTISPSIGNIALLEVFDLSNNVLKSTIPTQLGLLDGVLKRLDLSNNALSGVIPSEIGQLQGASILLEGNLFYNSSEAAPLSLCTLRTVEYFDSVNDTKLCPIERNVLNDFYDSAKGVEWTDRTNWQHEHTSYCEWKGVTCENQRVTKLNLRNNGLSVRLSEIIENLNLTALEVLDLSDNDIKGSIPTNISLLSNLTYLRLSYNDLTGKAPEGLGELTKLQLLQLQSNRITQMPAIPRLNESEYGNSTFVTDCGVPSAFKDPMECENCTMCCNANEDCYPQEKTRVNKMGLNYGTFATVLFASFVVFCCVVVLFLYHRKKRRNPGNAVTITRSEETEAKDDEYALSRIGKDSVYSYIVTDKALGWVGAFVTLGTQIFILVFFVLASEVDLQNDKVDIEFTWKCPRDTDACRNTADLTKYGWFVFVVLMIAFLAKDMINGCKLIYLSSERRHPIGSRIRYLIGGVGLCSITLFALYVSTIYNSVIATSNTAMIVNSVVVLFVMEIDECIFAALNAINDKWTEHASDSEEVSKMKEELEEKLDRQRAQIESQHEEIDNQQTQIASQQEELGILRSQQEELMIQRDEVARHNDEIAKLSGIVQQMQDSLEQSVPQSQSPPSESVTTQTSGLEDDSLERGVGRDDSADEGEDLNQLPMDETAFEMREQVIGRRRSEYPVMQNELEEPRGEVVAADADADANTSTSNVEKGVEFEEEKDEEL